MTIVLHILILLALAVTVASCVSDFRTMRIPNRHSVLLLGLFIAAYAVAPAGTFGAWWSPVGAFALMFAVTFGMYAAGMVGGGDTKLGAVLALWVGLKGLVVYLFYMALMGGILGLVSVVVKRKKPFPHAPAGSWIAQVQAGRNAVPYGIALGVGAWAAILHTGILHHGIHELIKTIH